MPSSLSTHVAIELASMAPLLQGSLFLFVHVHCMLDFPLDVGKESWTGSISQVDLLI
jgi:hypothetical protein